MWTHPKSWINSFSSPNLAFVLSACFQRENVQLSRHKRTLIREWQKKEEGVNGEWQCESAALLGIWWSGRGWPGRRDFHDLNSARGIRDGERRWDTPLSVPLAHTERPINSSASSARSFINVFETLFQKRSFWDTAFCWLVGFILFYNWEIQFNCLCFHQLRHVTFIGIGWTENVVLTLTWYPGLHTTDLKRRMHTNYYLD